MKNNDMLTPMTSKDNKAALQKLRNAIEHKMGYCFNTPTDFNNAANTVTQQTGRPISSTTLMRIWGYVQDGRSDYTPSIYTLSTLAIFLGYMDFRQFNRQHLTDEEVQSESYTGKSIAAEDIPLGAFVSVNWEPDRHCVLKHIKESHFEVAQASNCKVLVGDIVECVSFTQEAPLYCSRVWRDDQHVMTYIAGSKTGIRFQIKDEQ